MPKLRDWTTPVASDWPDTVDRLTVCSPLDEKPQTLTHICPEPAERNNLSQRYQVQICQHNSGPSWLSDQRYFHRRAHQQSTVVAWTILAQWLFDQVAFVGLPANWWQHFENRWPNSLLVHRLCTRPQPWLKWIARKSTLTSQVPLLTWIRILFFPNKTTQSDCMGLTIHSKTSEEESRERRT